MADESSAKRLHPVTLELQSLIEQKITLAQKARQIEQELVDAQQKSDSQRAELEKFSGSDYDADNPMSSIVAALIGRTIIIKPEFGRMKADICYSSDESRNFYSIRFAFDQPVVRTSKIFPAILTDSAVFRKSLKKMAAELEYDGFRGNDDTFVFAGSTDGVPTFTQKEWGQILKGDPIFHTAFLRGTIEACYDLAMELTKPKEPVKVVPPKPRQLKWWEHIPFFGPEKSPAQPVPAAQTISKEDQILKKLATTDFAPGGRLALPADRDNLTKMVISMVRGHWLSAAVTAEREAALNVIVAQQTKCNAAIFAIPERVMSQVAENLGPANSPRTGFAAEAAIRQAPQKPPVPAAVLA